MHRKGKTGREMAQLRERTATIAHVILGVNFQPANTARIIGDLGKMLRFIPNTGSGGQMIKT